MGFVTFVRNIAQTVFLTSSDRNLNVKFDVHQRPRWHFAHQESMSDGDGGRAGADAAPESSNVSSTKQQQPDVHQQQRDGDEWRRWLGQQTREAGSAIESNLSLFRVGCLLTMIGSMAAVARFSGAVSICWTHKVMEQRLVALTNVCLLFYCDSSSASTALMTSHRGTSRATRSSACA